MTTREDRSVLDGMRECWNPRPLEPEDFLYNDGYHVGVFLGRCVPWVVTLAGFAFTAWIIRASGR